MAANRDRLPVQWQHWDVACVERGHDLSSVLANATLSVEVADDVDAPRKDRGTQRRGRGRQRCACRGPRRTVRGRKHAQRRHELWSVRRCPAQQPRFVDATGIGIERLEISVGAPDTREHAVNTGRTAGGLLREPAGKRRTSPQGERRWSCAAMLVFVVVPHQAHHRIEWRAVGQRGESVAQFAQLRVAFGLDRASVAVEEPLERASPPHPHPVLKAAELVRKGGLKAAVVKEAERATIDEVAPAVASELAVVKIPVGDVVLGVAHDRVVIKEARHDIEPALVDEVAAWRIEAAATNQEL